jgi:hypothetical protein
MAVYILRHHDENIFKIGHSKNLNLRRKGLGTGNPYRLSVFDTIETEDAVSTEPKKLKQHTLCESFLHKKLRSKKFTEGDGREFFRVEPDELRKAVQDAREFLNDFVPKQREAARLSKERSNDEIIAPGPEERALYQRLLEIREEEDNLALERTILETKLKLIIGTSSGLQGLVTWKSLKRQDFDEREFKIKEPTLYQQYLRLSVFRRFSLK